MKNSWIKDQVAIVSGGASGIGRAIALEAARSGARVVIADLNEKMGRETLALVETLGAIGTFVATDATDSDAIRHMVEQADALGPIRYLANSAGLQTYGTLDTTTEKLWDETLDVNLKSMFLVSQQVLPHIRENGGGGIVNISSIQGLRCQKNVLAYATSKGAVIAMTRSMGLDHASEGIFVNCICPGAVDTPLLRFGAAQHGELQTVLKEWGAHHPIGRIGQPVEIAKLAMFLWSPDSNFIVGQAIAADGGLGSIIL
jgi:NAD(P)-dependent dehydrogenase (short-subunit alcohol dehydrogenase family)